MIVSTKGRYALRVMVYFVLHGSQEYIPLKQIAEEEGISQKYLEAIMTTLSKAGFVDAVHGKGGGYRLNRSPKEYTVGSILKLTNAAVAEALDGLPAHKMHCSVLAEEAIKAALKDYYDRNGIPYDKKLFPDCENCAHCHE